MNIAFRKEDEQSILMFSIFSVLSFLVLVPTGLATSLSIVEPAQYEMSWGTISVKAEFLNDTGNAITDANMTLKVLLDNEKIKEEDMTYNDGYYEGDISLVKEGVYTLDVETNYNGTLYTDEKDVYINSSKIEIDILAPNGTYAPGDIPVKLGVLVGGEENSSLELNLQVLKLGQIVTSKVIEYPYTDFITLNDEGVYTARVAFYLDGKLYERFSTFNVSEGELRIDVINPKNQTYKEGRIPIDVDVWVGPAFLHHASVSVSFYREGKHVKTIVVPEAQYHYSTSTQLDAGFYNAIIAVDHNGNVVRKNVSFTVPGVLVQNETKQVIPPNKVMKVSQIWTDLKRRYFNPGVDGVIAVGLNDAATGQEIKDANVTACVSLGESKQCFDLEEVEEPIHSYRKKFTFGLEGWYEIIVTAQAPGYLPVSEEFPPIQVGKPEVKPPQGSEVISNYIFTILSPRKEMTYSANKSVELMVQLLSKRGMPITDANVTASFDGYEFPMDYKINGEYTAKTERLKEGRYNVTFKVKHNNTVFTRNAELIVSADTLIAKIVHPLNENVTSNVVTIQASVTDNSGDIVPDANVRAILVSPKSGSHSIQLVRNLASGYYEISYTLDSPGDWGIKVVASKVGWVSGEDEGTFKALFEEEGMHFTTRDVIAGAIIVGSILVIILILKAIM